MIVLVAHGQRGNFLWRRMWEVGAVRNTTHTGGACQLGLLLRLKRFGARGYNSTQAFRYSVQPYVAHLSPERKPRGTAAAVPTTGMVTYPRFSKSPISRVFHNLGTNACKLFQEMGYNLVALPTFYVFFCVARKYPRKHKATATLLLSVCMLLDIPAVFTRRYTDMAALNVPLRLQVLPPCTSFVATNQHVRRDMSS